MKARILAGSTLAEPIFQDVRKKGQGLHLAVVQVGHNPASLAYIGEKKKAAEAAGIRFSLHEIEENVSQEELEKKITEIGQDPAVHGLLVQLPLPKHLDTPSVLDEIPLEKDVDVLSGQALKLFKAGRLGILPPTVCAVSLLLQEAGWQKEQKVVIVGKGRLVGLPLSFWFARQGAEPVMVDRATPNIPEVTKQADVLISAAGQAGLITGDMIKEGAIVIDAGTSGEEGKTKGDVDSESVSQKASAVSPVPGGVGPLTVACLLSNLVSLAKGK